MSDHPTIGASQISALLGIHPWMTQHDVWKQLVHGIKQEDNEALERGRKWEKHVLDMYEREVFNDETDFAREEILGKGVLRPIHLIRNNREPPEKHERGYLHATPDAWSNETPKLVEAKTSGETWDILPAYYHHQLQAQMFCWPGYPRADLAVLYPYFKFQIFRDILPDRDLQGQLNDTAERFIKDYVLPKKLPPVDATESCRQAIIAQWPKEESDEFLKPSREVLAALGKLKELEPEAGMLQALIDENKNLLRAFIGEKAGIQFEQGYASFKRNRGSSKTDWEQVARHFASWAKAAAWGSPDVDMAFKNFVKDNTRDVPGPRVLRIQWKKEAE